MVAIVMFHVPSLWHHPIEPITHAVPQSTHCEFESIPPVLVGMALVIAAMTGVMRNHGPSGEGEGGQRNNGKESHSESHSEHSDGSADVGPEDHFVEMADVCISLVSVQLFSEFLHVSSEGIVVVGFDPLVAFGEFGFGSRGRNTHFQELVGLIVALKRVKMIIPHRPDEADNYLQETRIK